MNPNEKTGSVAYLGLENLESQTGKLVGNYHHLYQDIKSTKNIFKKGDILFGKLRPNLNKVYFADLDGICSTDILVLVADEGQVNSKLLSYYLRSKEFNEQVLLTVSGQQLPRTSWEKISNLRIFLPDLPKQQKIVTEIEKIEKEISKLENQIAKVPERKQAILEKYL